MAVQFYFPFTAYKSRHSSQTSLKEIQSGYEEEKPPKAEKHCEETDTKGNPSSYS